jgi:hypothetical protein
MPESSNMIPQSSSSAITLARLIYQGTARGRRGGQRQLILPVMTDDTILPFSILALASKKGSQQRLSLFNADHDERCLNVCDNKRSRLSRSFCV